MGAIRKKDVFGGDHKVSVNGDGTYTLTTMDGTSYRVTPTSNPDVYQLDSITDYKPKTPDIKSFQNEMYQIRKSHLNDLERFAHDLSKLGFNISVSSKNKFLVHYTRYSVQFERFFEETILPCIKNAKQYKVFSPDILLTVNDYQLYRKKGVVELLKKYYDNSFFLERASKRENRHHSIFGASQAVQEAIDNALKKQQQAKVRWQVPVPDMEMDMPTENTDKPPAFKFNENNGTFAYTIPNPELRTGDGVQQL